jgi:predicted permease
MLQDIRYAFRQVRRNPGFAIVAIVTLALGIGANTAIFSVVDAALLKPLPFDEPRQLFEIAVVERRGTAEQTFYMGALTWDQIFALRAQSQLFAGIESYRRAQPMARTDGAAGETPLVARISAGMLSLLGIKPVRGRSFTREETTTAAPVALVSEGYWRRVLGADEQVIGRTLELQSHVYTIIGVAPLRSGPFYGTDVWLGLPERVDPRIPLSTGANVIARLRSGLTVASAETEFDRAVAHIQTLLAAPGPWEADLMSLDRDRFEMAAVLLVLLGAVGFVLLIACANVANLLLSRAIDRRREVAIRFAVGASRLRILRQFVIEGLAIAALGGVAALLAAAWLVAAIPHVVPQRLFLFGRQVPELDPRVLTFTLLVSLLCGVLSSLAPAVRSALRPSVSSGVKGAAAQTPSQRRLRNAFMAIQVGFTVVLLGGAGLMVNSFVRRVTLDTGFEPRNFAYVDIGLPTDRYTTKPSQDQFYSELLDAVKRVPAVTAVAIGTPPPSGTAGRFVLEGRERDTGESPALTIHSVDAGYFGVSGIRIVDGRDFGAQDHASAPRAAMVDEAAAHRFWPNQSAVGRRFRFSPLMPWLTVVGVVASIKTEDFDFPRGNIQIYLPMAQERSAPSRSLLIRTNDDPSQAITAVGTTVRRLEPRATIRRTGMVADLYEPALESPRFFSTLMSLFALLGLLTATAGLFGVLSYAVSQRTHEIGVRLALGAERGDVRRMVYADSLRPVAIGLCCGVLGAMWLTRFLSTQLYQVQPHDPLTYFAVTGFMIVVTAVAAELPARRAMRIDPIEALRHE